MTREERIVALAHAIGTDVKALLARSHQNLLYNATFQVNQRASVSGAFAAGAYTVDRWKAGGSGCTLTIPTSAPLRTLTITAGTLVQIIPAEDLEQGKQYVLSWTGTAQARVGTGVYSTSPITLTQGTANLQIEFSTGTITEPMLNRGSIAGFYEPESYQINLNRCARFFLTYMGRYGYFNPWGGLMFCRTSSATVGTWTAPVPAQMRAAPTITYAGSLCAVFNGSGTTYNMSMSFVCWTATPSFLEGDVTFASSVPANTMCLIRGYGTGNGSLGSGVYFNCEL